MITDTFYTLAGFYKVRPVVGFYTLCWIAVLPQFRLKNILDKRFIFKYYIE
jgi:hypothetical protein